MLTNLKKKGLVLAESSRYSPSFGESRHVETAGHVMPCYVMSEEKATSGCCCVCLSSTWTAQNPSMGMVPPTVGSSSLKSR